jgi:hypothetical protein
MKLRAIVISSTLLFSLAPAFAQSNAPITIGITNSDNQDLNVRVSDQLGSSGFTGGLSQGSSQPLTIASDQNGQGVVTWVAMQTIRDDGANGLKCAKSFVGQVNNGQQVGIRIDYGSPCGCPC